MICATYFWEPCLNPADYSVLHRGRAKCFWPKLIFYKHAHFCVFCLWQIHCVKAFNVNSSPIWTSRRKARHVTTKHLEQQLSLKMRWVQKLIDLVFNQNFRIFTASAAFSSNKSSIARFLSTFPPCKVTASISLSQPVENAPQLRQQRSRSCDRPETENFISSHLLLPVR